MLVTGILVKEKNCIDFTIPLGEVGINEANDVSFRMYPNPVESTLNIENLGDANLIEIFSVVGERVISIDNINTESVRIETNNLTKGIYLITVHSNGVVESTKFIKK